MATDDNEARISATHDFGRTITRRPRTVLDADPRDGSVHALALARREAARLVVRGAGHSCGGQTLATDAIVLRSFAAGPTDVRPEGAIVAVPARASWRDLEFGLNRQGWMAPVTTDYLALSVGGTLSVGGFGFESVSRGVQGDHVAWMRVRFADGSTRVLERDDELARFILGGLGRLAILEEVGLRVQPFLPITRMFTRRHADLVALAEAMAWVDDPKWQPPTAQVAVQHWPDGDAVEKIGDEHLSPEHAARATVPDWPGACAAPQLVAMRRFADHLQVRRWIEGYADHRRIWCDFGFTHAGFVEFVRRVDRLRRTTLGSVVRAVYLGAVRRPPADVAPSAFDLRIPGASCTFTCGLYAMVPAGDPQLVDRTLDELRRTTEVALELGGRPYLYGRYDLEDRDRAKVYGDDYTRYLELKRTLDPDGLLVSGAGVL